MEHWLCAGNTKVPQSGCWGCWGCWWCLGCWGCPYSELCDVGHLALKVHIASWTSYHQCLDRWQWYFIDPYNWASGTINNCSYRVYPANAACTLWCPQLQWPGGCWALARMWRWETHVDSEQPSHSPPQYLRWGGAAPLPPGFLYHLSLFTATKLFLWNSCPNYGRKVQSINIFT